MIWPEFCWSSDERTSLDVVLDDCKLEPALAEVTAGVTVQFERLGYFTPDNHGKVTKQPIFNRTVTLRDTWAKVTGKRR